MWNLGKIYAYLPKIGGTYWPLDQWTKPLCVTDMQASSYKESKHQFVLIVKP